LAEKWQGTPEESSYKSSRPPAARSHYFSLFPSEKSEPSLPLPPKLGSCLMNGLTYRTPRSVSLMDYDLGYFDLETPVLEPPENPFGPKVLAIS
jgi:hypothetical protein